MQHAITRSRVWLVLLMTVGLILGSLAAPAAATEGGGDDVDSVRAQTLNTIDYKMGLLTDLRNGTENADRKAEYDTGIAQLASLRGDAVGSDNIDALRSMDAQAHEIYYATKARAAAVGQTDAEKVAEMRKAALETINYKLSIFREAKGKTDNAAHREIYAAAIGDLEALKAAAEKSDDIGALEEMKSQAHKIYDRTKAQIAEKGGDEGDKKEEVEEPKEKTKAEIEAEALAKAKRSTLRLIEHKLSIFTHAAEAAKNRVVAAVYADAAEQIAGLVDDAKEAGTVGALREIDEKIMKIYDDTKAAVSESHGKPEWQPSEAMIAHVAGISGVIDRLDEFVKSTADDSPNTAKAIAKAADKVRAEIKDVQAAAETGNKLDGSWSDLKKAIHTYRKALAEHVVAVTGGPGCVNGWHLPA